MWQKVQSIQNISSFKNFEYTDGKAKQAANFRCQQLWQSVSPSWELFAMPSSLSHGQFCTLTDYIWRPAGLQNQTYSTAIPDSPSEK